MDPKHFRVVPTEGHTKRPAIPAGKKVPPTSHQQESVTDHEGMPAENGLDLDLQGFLEKLPGGAPVSPLPPTPPVQGSQESSGLAPSHETESTQADQEHAGIPAGTPQHEPSPKEPVADQDAHSEVGPTQDQLMPKALPAAGPPEAGIRPRDEQSQAKTAPTPGMQRGALTQQASSQVADWAATQELRPHLGGNCPGVDAGLVGVLNNCLAMSRDILRSDGPINRQPEPGLTVAVQQLTNAVSQLGHNVQQQQVALQALTTQLAAPKPPTSPRNPPDPEPARPTPVLEDVLDQLNHSVQRQHTTLETLVQRLGATTHPAPPRKPRGPEPTHPPVLQENLAKDTRQWQKRHPQTGCQRRWGLSSGPQPSGSKRRRDE